MLSMLRSAGSMYRCGAPAANSVAADAEGRLEAASRPVLHTALFPQRTEGLHPVVPMFQALGKHIEQLVALPDELRLTTVLKFKKPCDSCNCERE